MNIIEKLKANIEELKEKRLLAQNVNEQYLSAKEDYDQRMKDIVDSQNKAFNKMCKPILVDIANTIIDSMEELCLAENLGKKQTFLDSNIFKNFKKSLDEIGRELGIYFYIELEGKHKDEVALTFVMDDDTRKIRVQGDINFNEPVYFCRGTKPAEVNMENIAMNLEKYLDWTVNLINTEINKQKSALDAKMMTQMYDVEYTFKNKSALDHKEDVEEDNDEIER